MTPKTNHTAMNTTTTTAMNTTTTTSPSPARPLSTPPHRAATDTWGPYSSSRSFFSNMATILIILACVSLLAFSLHTAARLLRRRLSLRRASTASPQPPKPPSRGGSGGAASADSAAAEVLAGGGLAGGWAEAECAICLAEFAEGERIRVLTACGHGFHAACVEGWLTARASCPTCRAPWRPPAQAGEP